MTLALEVDATSKPPARALVDVSSVFDAHADFVWLSLQRLGVREADLEDLLQEVFVVVHRNLSTFEANAKMTTWLFGIATKVAAGQRRRAHVRREELVDEIPAAIEATTNETPEDLAATRQAQRDLDAILGELDAEKRAVFVMFEIDELGCDEIATALGVPIGTVYSRLHAARKSFEKAVGRRRARETHGGGR